MQVVWCKRDLRVHDHEPLVRAAAAGPVIPLYVAEPDVVWSSPDHDPRHLALVVDALADLRASLTRLGAPLVVRTGNVVDVLDDLRERHGVGAVWAHEETGNLATYARDRAVAAWARRTGVAFHEIPQPGVIRRLHDRDDWWARREERLRHPLLRPPERLTGVPGIHPGPLPDVTDPIPASRQPGGETAARATLASFLDGRARGYEANLSSPRTAVDGCSRLSVHLALGTLGMREVVQRTRAAAGRADPALRRSLQAFEERLGWHDHFVQKLEDEPALERRSYLPAFDALRPDVDDRRLAAWTEGRTGYPFLDACLRSVAATGWLPFRQRAMVVTFAAYDLWLPWQAFGVPLARWFTDYEPGIHWPQVQMQSGTSGINALRVYDPVKQGLDHDPDGTFTRAWVPELAHVPGPAVHRPWLLTAPPPGYPPPVVDHARAAAEAVARVEAVRRSLGPDRLAVLERHGSRRPASQRRAPGPGPGGRGPGGRGSAGRRPTRW